MRDLVACVLPATLVVATLLTWALTLPGPVPMAKTAQADPALPLPVRQTTEPAAQGPPDQPLREPPAIVPPELTVLAEQKPSPIKPKKAEKNKPLPLPPGWYTDLQQAKVVAHLNNKPLFVVFH